MASFLKEILLRHQKWEEEEKEPGNVHSPASATADASALSDVPEAQQRPPCERRDGQKTRYRTRPPGLRSSTNVNVGANATSTLSFGAADTATAPSPPARSSRVPNHASFSSLAAPRESITASPNQPPPAAAPSFSATLALPFTPYPVQQEMCAAISSVLSSCKPHVVPVAVAEVPTGCGKTMALLSGVLRYQQELKRMTAREVDAFHSVRQPPWRQQQQRLPKATKMKSRKATRGRAGDHSSNPGSVDNDVAENGGNSGSEAEEESGWSVPPSFFKHFRIDSQRKIRAELDVTGSQELRRRFLSPPCTIYYVTRTHAQLRQAVRELRRLQGASSAIKMNILGSRTHYCIHPKVVQGKASHTLPVEGNNLGEVCDKLVSMGLCEMVDHYDELSCSAIGGPIGHQHGLIWDMEDLVLEGSGRTMCPYYAARDLVFFADINFCTYPYLLDPLIRHETKMEAALKNNAIIVFDEAHNVAAVCQDALSLECPQGVIAVILSELAPLVANHHTLARQPTAVSSSGRLGDGFATMQYPREVQLGGYTLVEIFSFLYAVFHSLKSFLEQNVGVANTTRPHTEQKRPRDTGRDGKDEGDCSSSSIPGATLEHHLRRDMESHVRAASSRSSGSSSSSSSGEPREQREQRSATAKTPAVASLDLFQRAYSVIMSLGVTFNPFLFSVFGLSMLKRWLLLLRFLFQRSRSFVLSVTGTASAEKVGAVASVPGGHGTTASHVVGPDGVPPTSRSVVEVRCLDGSLAFNHLLHSVHRVVLTSGTLAPFTQLARDLGLEASLWRTVEGLHVVPASQYRLTALTALPGATTSTPLRCTYTSLSSPTFLKAVARTVVQLTRTVQQGSGGGVLFFVPNYVVLHSLAKMTREVLLAQAQESTRYTSPRFPIRLFVEPRKAEALPQVLHDFQCCTQGTQGGTALFFSVYRGKVSEGLDFTDAMARLVLCLGVPLQPLKSWKVVAQRTYSGPEWYTTDAVRAVNQALGRCLRHVRDYGAVVLLDERYAQADYQLRLSRWCRDALQAESSLPQLCEALQTAFAQWHRELGPAPLSSSATASAGEQDSTTTDAAATILAGPVSRRAFEVDSQLTHSLAGAGDGVRGRLGTEQLPFQYVRRTPPLRTAHPLTTTTTAAVRATDTGGTATRTVETSFPLQSPFACTAVKLLYETCASTTDVVRQDLQAAIALLAENFGEDDVESSQED